MEHSDALRLHAAEKYILGELSAELREQYEEHYFDCDECASDLKAAAAFADTARDVFRKESPEASTEQHGFKAWFAWLRPVIAAPALAALLVMVSYETFVAIPRLQHQATVARIVQPADFLSLIGANSRAQASKVFQLHRDRPAVLEVDIPPSGDFAGYICQVQNASGGVVYTTRVSAADAKNTVHVVIPPDSRKAGEYSLVILGEPSSGYNAAPQNEVARFAFSVELLP